MKNTHYYVNPLPDSSNPALELLTVPEVAKLLKISTVSVRRLQQGRWIPFYKVGGSVRFVKSDIATYLESRRIGIIER